MWILTTTPERKGRNGTQGEADMFTLHREVETKVRNAKDAKFRTTYVATTQVSEYEATSGYQSVTIDLHSADIDSLKIKTRTRKLPDGTKYKVKRIEFTDADGINHEIRIFGS